MKPNVPDEIKSIAEALEKAGYQAYLVGGCVRDLLLNREPKDWDVATNAKPEDVLGIFPDSVYENQFGTVGVKIPTPKGVGTPTSAYWQSVGAESPEYIIVEITTLRKEGKYTDKRHPDNIKFTDKIEDDLSRRDFTINAMALMLTNNKKQTTSNSHKSSVMGYELVDPFGGEKDIDKNLIKTVGIPDERFGEDALRLMRAVRFATELGFQIDLNTRRAIEKNAGLLEMIAKERIRDELIKIIMSDRAAQGIILLEELNLLQYVIPELREGLGCGQNKHHIYSVFEHNIRADY